MKIGILGSGTASRELPPHLTLEADRYQETEITLVQPRLSVFAFSAYERLVVDVGYVDAAIGAARSGCNAILINSFADYGIDAARAAIEIPILGAGEAALQEAAKIGHGRFCILTVWPKSMGFLYNERLRSLEMSSHCLAIHHYSNEDELSRLTSDNNVMTRMAGLESQIINELAKACDQLMAQYQPDSIVLGCTCMSPIATALAERCRAPIIDGSVSGLRRLCSDDLSTQIELNRMTTQTDRVDLIPNMVSAWIGAAHVPAPEPTPDCPVCITTVD